MLQSSHIKCVSNQLGFPHSHSPTQPLIFARHIVGVSPYSMCRAKCVCASALHSHKPTFHRRCKTHIEYGAGIIMANHFRNHVTENVHHIKLCSIMHVCTPILIICVYRSLHCIGSTNIVFADDMLYRLPYR